jgi:hypothetical protein
MPPTQAQRIELLEREIEEMKAAMQAHFAKSQETHDMVRRLTEKLMIPQPGHDKSLLDRMASVTIDLERGKWGALLLRWVLGTIIAIGGTIAAVQMMRGQG